MKFILQATLFVVLIIISLVFYENYFSEKNITVLKEENKIQVQSLSNDQGDTSEDQNNVIKNLKYNVDLTDSGKYEIKSDLGQLIIKDETEIVAMNNVTAIFSDINNKKLYILSEYAEFNTNTYNTLFRDNIRIIYEEHEITSYNLDFDFIKNNILVYENVIYTGMHGKIQTDNIRIDLITKNVEIFMNDEKENIKVISF